MARRTPARRFLAPQARAGNGLGYLSQPQREYPVVADEPELVDRISTCTDWRDEPEGLDRLDYKMHIDERAKQAAEQQQKFETRQREQARRLMDFETRLATAQNEARKRRIDVTSDIRLLRHMQQSGKQVRHLETRLGAVERKVWREPDDLAA